MFRRKILGMVLLTGMLVAQSVPRAHAATYCDHAQFISDLTAPDGATFAAGIAFTKTWRLKNIGTCGWTTSYSVVFAGGDLLGGPASIRLPVDVAPGQMVDLSVNLTAPTMPGHFKGSWKLSNHSGAQFGIGDSASDAFWVDINVIDTTAAIYDFVANATYAQWRSGAGVLPFPGTSGDSRGFAFQVNNPHLEDDSIDASPGLLTVPQNKFNGYIQATYPEFQVQQGDRLQTLVNCEFGAKGCYVTFRIDYLLPNGVQKTLWTWKEASEGRFFRASIDLSPLAGQKVRFILILLSSGFASGDRALWGSPRIVRAGTVLPPAPPSTLTPLPPLTPTQTPITPPPPTLQPAGCDRASFAADVTVPDGAVFAPGAAFTKTWRLKNSGSCVWTTAYKLVYYSGEQMGAPTTVNLPWSAGYGQTVDVSVNMVAPSANGEYRGFWILSNASGKFFGIGADASRPIWAEIKVAGEAPHEGGYQFWLNACSAQWKSGAGPLPCPGVEGDRKGFIIPLNYSHLEDGTMGPAPSLLMSPENKYNGYIQGIFPTFTVQPGDHFVTGAGCEYGYSCYATFRLDYMTPNGGIFNFWSWREQNDKKNYLASVDLTPLAGRSVRFILTLLATGSPTGDRVRWGGPSIVRVEGPIPSSPTPAPPSATLTPTPPASDWLTYANASYGFQFRYPPQAQLLNQVPESLLMVLLIAPGTNLVEKYLDLRVLQNVSTCAHPLAVPSANRETVVINGVSFLKDTGMEQGAGQIRKWTGYSTTRGNTCLAFLFVLHSANPGNFATPVPLYDEAAESAIFSQMMQTFAWNAPVPPTDTPTPIPNPGTVVPSPIIRSLSMIDASNGWAIGDTYLLRTTDGGVTWYNVLPEATTITGSYFPNAATGWVITPGSLYRTTNGGASWTWFDNVPFNGGHLQFLDINTGYVLETTGAAMHKQSVILYKTSDGGVTWAQIYNNDPNSPGAGTSLPLGGHKNGMTFRDPINGWIGGDYPTAGYVYFYRTSDGGANWSPILLTKPIDFEYAFITINAPTFFGANDAILPVWMTRGSGRELFLYVSHDGGNTWTPSTSFARGAEFTDVISMSHTISWDWTNLFHVTNNSGGSWTTVTPNVNFGEDFRGLDFVSPSTGWLIQAPVNGSTPLYRTTDGGYTWTILSGGYIPSPDPAAFAQSIVDALNARDFDSVKAKMDQTFAFAYWESQGTSSTPDQAIEAFRTRHLGATPLTADPSKDLNVLLGGLNPYSIMGLDPARSRALFASGWGADGKSEAVLYVTRRADGSLYFYGVLIAPVGFIHATPTSTPTLTPTATPAALIGPYAVVNVGPSDVLNIRSGAGVSQSIIGYYPPDATDVMRTGPSASADGAMWVEVRRGDGLAGWVNSYYLTEYVTHDAFCTDSRIPPLIEQVKQSMSQSNGNLLSPVVSPVHGVNMHLWAYGPGINFTQAAAADIYTSTTVYNWGGGPRGVPDTGTFNAAVKPKYLEVLNAPNRETYCDDLTKVFPLSRPWPYPNIRFYNLYKPASDLFFDFRTLLIGFEYINGQPYVYGMVTIIWEP